jgi:YggT family protein
VDSEPGAVGGHLASVLVLADAETSVRRFVDVFVGVYGLLILAYVISSLIQVGYTSPFARVQRFLYDVCDPYLRLFRRFIRPIGPLDLSPIAAFASLYVIHRLLDELIQRVL